VATEPERLTYEVAGSQLRVQTAEVCWVNSDIAGPLTRRP
jgi:hypothetical protein